MTKKQRKALKKMGFFVDKKAQTAITVFFGVVIFLIGYFLFFAEWLSYWTEETITTHNLTGLEAFLLSNLNLVVIVALIVFIFASLYFGGER